MQLLLNHLRQLRGVTAMALAVIFLTGGGQTVVKAGTALSLGFTTPSSVNESNSTAYLTWTADPNKIYKIRSSTNLSMPNPWMIEDAVTSTSAVTGPMRWMAPESPLQQKFYQLVLPQVQIFSVEPAVVEPGVSQPFDVIGQCFDSNCTLSINGVVISNAVLSGSTVISTPSFTPDVPGSYVFRISSGGQVQAAFSVLAVAASLHPEQVLQGPPDEPPASPAAKPPKVLRAWFQKLPSPTSRAKSGRSYTGGKFALDIDGLVTAGSPGAGTFSDESPASVGGERLKLTPEKVEAGSENIRMSGEGSVMDYNTDGPDFTLLMPALMKAKEKANQTKCMARCVQPFSGEVQECDIDMYIPGRTLDFIWERSYRSRVGTNTTMGTRWTHSYDVHAEQGASGITVSDGTGCRRLYVVGGDGAYTCDEMFNQGTVSQNTFTLTFADSGKWVFNPFDGSVMAGKLIRIITRNGDTMTLGYDTSGRLSSVVDDLGRTNTVAYTSDGHVSSVTDFTGRSVTYQYYQGAKGDNGGAGDLKSVTSPPVTGTPNGNDFPSGKTTTYTYSTSFPVSSDQENHLLLTITDPKGQTAAVFSYEHSSSSPNYLCCTSAQEGTNTPSVMNYSQHEIHKPTYPGSASIECIVNDPVGNVTEMSFDSRNRLLRLRQDTGRAVPGIGVGPLTNRPANPLRSTDPAYYDTTCSWNNDSLCTGITNPSGRSMQYVYQRDLDSSLGARKNGDLRVCRSLACCDGGDVDGDGFADTTVLTRTWQYDPRFGSPAKGERRSISVIMLSDDGTEKSTSGVHFVNGYGLPFALSAPEAVYVNPRSIARQQYFFAQNVKKQSSGSGWSALIGGIPAGGAITKFPPRKGWDCTIKGVREAIYEDRWPCAGDFDFNDECIAYNDARGNTTSASYDTNGNLLHVERYARKNGALCSADFNYKNGRQLSAVTNAPDGTGHRRVDTYTYYTNGPEAGYLQSCVIDAGGLALTHSYEFDPRGNLTRYLDPGTNDWLCTYNALDQPVQISSASISLCFCKIEYKYSYDADDKLVRFSVDNLDPNGVVGTNATWDTQFSYDQENRMVSVTSPPISGTNTAVTTFAYDSADECVQVSSPEAVAGHDPACIIQYFYDERKDMLQWTRATGSTAQMTCASGYDLDGRLATVSSTTDSCNGGTTCMQTDLTLSYDGFGRCVSMTDAMGNVETCAYDRNDNLIYARVDGETNDVPGSVHNVRLSECRYVYDGLDRCVSLSQSFFDPATQAMIGGGTAATSCTYAPNGLCVTVTDALGNTGTCAYDTACRLSSMTDARGDFVVVTRDVYGNPRLVTETDLSDAGTSSSFSISNTYDSLQRLVQTVDDAGNTNAFAYDSRDNCVSETDPLGNTTLHYYDSLSRCVATAFYQGASSSGVVLRTSQSAFDNNGRCVSTTDANSNVTHFSYDSLDNLASVTNPDGTSRSMIWSPRSNLLIEQDENGTTITNVYDARDRIIHRDIAARNVLATTTFENFSYDGLSHVTYAGNDVSQSTFSYDSMGNSLRCSQDGLVQSATFDAGGDCLSMTYPGGSVMSYAYDVLNRITNIAATVSGVFHPQLTSLTYDGPDRVSGIIRDNGIITRCAFDGLASPPNASGDFGFLQVSRVSHQNASGTVVIDRRVAKFDRNQNRIQRNQTVPFFNNGPTTSNAFSYDGLNQLDHAINTKGAGAEFTDYSLDLNGNRLSVTSNGVVGTYSMNASSSPPFDFVMNQYTSTPFGSLSYDADGDISSAGTVVNPYYYQYDYAHRLISASTLDAHGKPLMIVSFSYDALGRRISKTTYPAAPASPVTTQYVLSVGAVLHNGLYLHLPAVHACGAGGYESDQDCGGAVLEERVGATVSRVYVYRSCTCPDGCAVRCVRVAFPSGGSPQYYHCDDLGSTLALSDSSGNVLERYDYDDFGAPQFLTTDGSQISGATASSCGNPYLFRGMQWDGETGLYLKMQGVQNNPLYVDPRTGRCITRCDTSEPQMAVRGKVVCVRIDLNARTVFGNNPWSGDCSGSSYQTKPEEPARKKEYVGHVTLIK